VIGLGHWGLGTIAEDIVHGRPQAGYRISTRRENTALEARIGEAVRAAGVPSGTRFFPDHQCTQRDAPFRRFRVDDRNGPAGAASIASIFCLVHLPPPAAVGRRRMGALAAMKRRGSRAISGWRISNRAPWKRRSVCVQSPLVAPFSRISPYLISRRS